MSTIYTIASISMTTVNLGLDLITIVTVLAFSCIHCLWSVMSLTTSFIHIFYTPFNFRYQILENWISAVGRLWFSAPQLSTSLQLVININYTEAQMYQWSRPTAVKKLYWARNIRISAWDEHLTLVLALPYTTANCYTANVHLKTSLLIQWYDIFHHKL